MVYPNNIARGLDVKIEVLGDQSRHDSRDLGFKTLHNSLPIMTLTVSDRAIRLDVVWTLRKKYIGLWLLREVILVAKFWKPVVRKIIPESRVNHISVGVSCSKLEQTALAILKKLCELDRCHFSWK